MGIYMKAPNCLADSDPSIGSYSKGRFLQSHFELKGKQARAQAANTKYENVILSKRTQETARLPIQLPHLNWNSDKLNYMQDICLMRMSWGTACKVEA